MGACHLACISFGKVQNLRVLVAIEKVISGLVWSGTFPGETRPTESVSLVSKTKEP